MIDIVYCNSIGEELRIRRQITQAFPNAQITDASDPIVPDNKIAIRLPDSYKKDYLAWAKENIPQNSLLIHFEGGDN